MTDKIDLNEYTIKYDYPVVHRKIKNYKGFQRRFVVQIKTTYVQEWTDYSEKYHLREHSALNELRYAAASRNVTDARIVQILP